MPESARIEAGHASAPLFFEANRGQANTQFKFIARGPHCAMLIAPTEAVLVLGNPDSRGATRVDVTARLVSGASRPAQHARSVRFELLKANPQALIEGIQPLPCTANYYLGNDPARWLPGIPLFNKVQVDEVYPGVRLVYYANNSAQFEYDFILQPGARLDQILIRIEGTDCLSLDSRGDLLMSIGTETIRQQAPVLYQVVDGARKPVRGGYRLIGDSRAGFWAEDYDPALPLVLDPTFSFATYLGGASQDRGWGAATDPNGNLWVVGETLSALLPTTPGALQRLFQGGYGIFGDGFVARFEQGTNLTYLTYLGGTGQDAAFAVAVDPNTGAAFVTGYTDSPGFPVFPRLGAAAVFQPQLGGTNLNARRVYPIDAFVTKLNADGTLAYSTFLGGIGRDVGQGIAVDDLGRAYVAGYTDSRRFPAVAPVTGFYLANGARFSGGIQHGSGDAFVARLNTNGTALEYSSRLGGGRLDTAEAIAVDAAYSAHVAGITASPNFPVLNALSSRVNNGLRLGITDGFISKLSPDGRSLIYSTYIGGRQKDIATSVAVDPAANAYLTGYTHSTDFPQTSTNFFPWPNSNNVTPQAFAIKLDPNGSTNGNYSVVFGARGVNYGLGIAADSSQNAYVVGFTTSRTNFAGLDHLAALPPGFSATNSSVRAKGNKDAFLIALDPSGNASFTSYIGGAGNDQANGIALDTSTPGTVGACITGITTSRDFPGTDPSTFRGRGRVTSAFVTRILFP